MSDITICDYCGKPVGIKKEKVSYDLCNECESKGCVTIVGKQRTKTITWEEYNGMFKAGFVFVAFWIGFMLGCVML